jgi:hypothetical protein
MKKIYLTFDVETIVSRMSYNPNFYTNVLLGAIYIAQELEKRNMKATFFISLSPKTDEIDSSEYIESIQSLIGLLKKYKNIKIQPHMHMKNLPLTFNTVSDKFSEYTLHEQIEALTWAKEIFEGHGIEVDSFRPGSYSANKQYYEALSKAGYKYSSIMKFNEVDIDTIRDIVAIKTLEKVDYGIIEYPVTSLLIKSIKRKEEVVNLSPDFFTYSSVQKYIEQSEYVNINFHSFSIFSNRLARENHEKLLVNNIKYIFFEKPLIKLLKPFGYEVINHNTLFRNAFIDWIDGMELFANDTYFIGE